MQLIAFLDYGRLCGEHREHFDEFLQLLCRHARVFLRGLRAQLPSGPHQLALRNKKHTNHTSESGSNDSAMRVSSSRFVRSEASRLARRASSSFFSCSSSSSISSSWCCSTSSRCLYDAFSESTSSSASLN